ncbi:MAG: TetR/AcrR family transcriptional regulator [Pseudomonadota bacterium]
MLQIQDGRGQMDRRDHKVDGHQKRRQATRERLMLAAKSVMAETPAEAVAVDDIIREAGLGKGSFYNHFKSKEDLFFATLDDLIGTITGTVQTTIRDIEDPAEALAIGIALHVKLATADPKIGRFIANAPASSAMFSRYADPVVHQTIDKGISTGRFTIPNRKLYFVILTSSVNAVLLGRLEEQFNDGAVEELVEAMLLLAGLSLDEARELASKPMPSA